MAHGTSRRPSLILLGGLDNHFNLHDTLPDRIQERQELSVGLGVVVGQVVFLPLHWVILHLNLLLCTLLVCPNLVQVLRVSRLASSN